MRWTSIAAIFVLFWTISLFLVHPFGVRTSEEAGVQVEPGHAESAPHLFSFPRAALRATIVALILFAIFYANYLYGWITIDELDWAR
jgi:predicted secreted protein